MSRRRRVIHKEEKHDSRYGSALVARLIGTIMHSGKRSIAERVAYSAIEESRQSSDAVDPLETLNKAIDNIRPRLETKIHILAAVDETFVKSAELPPDFLSGRKTRAGESRHFLRPGQ